MLQMNAPFHTYIAQVPYGYAHPRIIKQLVHAFSLNVALGKFGKLDPILVESFFFSVSNKVTQTAKIT